MGLKVKTPPSNDALWLADAKAHLRVRHDDDNRDILLAIKAATTWVEEHIEGALITRTYEQGFDFFADELELQRPPLITVNAVKYYDTAGVQQTLDPANYYVDDMGSIGKIVPIADTSWPLYLERPNTVIVDFDAGFGTSPLDIPGDIAAALKLLVGHFYENREQQVIGTIATEMKFGVESLLAPYRIINV